MPWWRWTTVSTGLVITGLVWFAALVRPPVTPGQVRGPLPDSRDYAYGAEALLSGRYVVSWDGTPDVPRYPPGFSVLLLPAVALGGVASAVWIPFLAALALGSIAAVLAARLGGAIAAPIAVVTVLGAAAPVVFARLVMSDVPSTTLAILGLLLIAIGRGPAAALGAGAIAGALVWIRPTNLVLVLAGIAGYSARGEGRRSCLLYLVGVVPFVALLGVWQWATFGSPVTTGYQAAQASPDGSSMIGSFFSLANVWKPVTWLVDMDAHPLRWQLPNIVLYPLALLGADLFLTLPTTGVIGLIAMARLSRERGVAGVVGRYGIASLALMLAVHLPYFYQAERYLFVPTTVANLCAAAVIGRALHRHVSRLAAVGRFSLGPPGQNSRRPTMGLALASSITVLALLCGVVVLGLGTAPVPEPGSWIAWPLGAIAALQQLMDRYGLE
jgi:hypothetical protein